jgi:hypothetical protein
MLCLSFAFALAQKIRPGNAALINNARMNDTIKTMSFANVMALDMA